jgi:predicted dehydrogenase
MTLVAGNDYCGIDGDIKSALPRPPDGAWRKYPDWCPDQLGESYERFVNVCGHNINLLRYLFDDAAINFRHVKFSPPNTGVVGLEIDDIALTFSWAEVPTSTRWSECFFIEFEFGKIELSITPAFLRNQPSCLKEHRYTRGRTDWVRAEYLSNWEWSFRNEDKEFLEAIIAGSQTVSSGASSVGDFELIDKIWHGILD